MNSGTLVLQVVFHAVRGCPTVLVSSQAVTGQIGGLEWALLFLSHEVFTEDQHDAETTASNDF